MTESKVRAYHKKPVQILAIQDDGTWSGLFEIAEFLKHCGYYEYDSAEDVLLNIQKRKKDSDTTKSNAKYFYYTTNTNPMSIVIHTLEGDMMVSPEDFVIKGIHGECYPCKPDIFEKTYDFVEGEVDDCQYRNV